MIRFKNVTKTFKKGNITKLILDNASFDIPKGLSPAIIGLNGAGKSTLLRLISGADYPDSGEITRHGVSISWTLGLASGFQGSLSGAENVRFVARLYGCDAGQVLDYVIDFADIGDYMRMPVKTYSSGMRSRLAVGLSMAIDFDYYLIDEIISVGDAEFRKKCDQVFESKRKKAHVIMVSHSEATLKKYCNSAILLKNGTVRGFDDVSEALKVYNSEIRKLVI